MLLCSDRDMQPEDAMSQEHHQSTAAAAAAIEAEFGGRWGVWLSDTGRWWAARTSTLTSDQANAGCVPFIEADSPGELIEHIRQQDRLGSANQDTAP
jgi:hypothetical protein